MRFFIEISDQAGNFLLSPKYNGVRVKKMTWEIPGGPQDALLEVDFVAGGRSEVEKLAGCGMRILDETLSPVWWGYIETVQVQDASYSLANLCNRLSVYAYPYTRLLGETVAVSPVSPLVDPASTIIFGRKDGCAEFHGILEENQVLEAGRRELFSRSFPEWDCPAIVEGNVKNLRVGLDCRGWWNTLNWGLSDDLAGWEGVLPVTAAEQSLNEDINLCFGIQQPFQVRAGAAWMAKKIWLRFHSAGEDVDGLSYELWKTQTMEMLTGDSISGRGLDLSGGMQWRSFDLPQPVLLEPGENYFIRLPVKHFIYGVEWRGRFEVDEYITSDMVEMSLANQITTPNLYTQPYVYSQKRSPAARLVFLLTGEVDQLLQIEGLALNSPAGQFLTGVDNLAGAGAPVNVYPNRRQTIRRTVEDMLQAGDGSGRWVDAVISDKKRMTLRFREEETRAQMGGDGVMRDFSGRIIPLRELPLGGRIQTGGGNSTRVTRAVWENGSLKIN